MTISRFALFSAIITSASFLGADEDMNWGPSTNQYQSTYNAQPSNQQGYSPTYSYSQTTPNSASSGNVKQQSQQNSAPTYSRSQLQNQPQISNDSISSQQWQNRSDYAPAYSRSQLQNQSQTSNDSMPSQQWQSRSSYPAATSNYPQNQTQTSYFNRPYSAESAGNRGNYGSQDQQSFNRMQSHDENMEDADVSNNEQMSTSAEEGHEASDGSGEMEG